MFEDCVILDEQAMSPVSGEALDSDVFAKTPTVGNDESTIPIASYPTSGPKSDQNID